VGRIGHPRHDAATRRCATDGQSRREGGRLNTAQRIARTAPCGCRRTRQLAPGIAKGSFAVAGLLAEVPSEPLLPCVRGERNVFPWGSSPGTRLGNALQTTRQTLGGSISIRVAFSGVALISECRFVRYSLAFQGIYVLGAFGHVPSLEKWLLGTALEHQTGPSRADRGDGFRGMLGHSGDYPCPALLGSRLLRSGPVMNVFHVQCTVFPG